MVRRQKHSDTCFLLPKPLPSQKLGHSGAGELTLDLSTMDTTELEIQRSESKFSFHGRVTMDNLLNPSKLYL